MSKHLIECIEELQTPDRDCDGEIAKLFGWTYSKGERDARPYWRKRGETEWFMRTALPPFTSSVNDALTLIPDGLFWIIAKGVTRQDEPLYGAQLLMGSIVVAEGETDASPAAALCIAVLRWLARQSGDRTDIATAQISPELNKA